MRAPRKIALLSGMLTALLTTNSALADPPAPEPETPAPHSDSSLRLAVGIDHASGTDTSNVEQNGTFETTVVVQAGGQLLERLFDSHVLLEGELIGSVKVGQGGYPALIEDDQGNSTPRMSTGPAAGISIRSGIDVTYKPLHQTCGPAATAGVSAAAGLTAMHQAPGTYVNTDAVSIPFVGLPDSMLQLKARGGIGLACISSKLFLVVSPMLEAILGAPESGKYLGARVHLGLPRNLDVILEAAHTMGATQYGEREATGWEASLQVRKHLGLAFVGADARISDSKTRDSGSNPGLQTEVTSVGVTAVAGIAF